MIKGKPFVKWAGGKRQIIDKLLNYVPDEFDTYYEPMVGGGALLFELSPKKAVINDSNKVYYNAKVLKEAGVSLDDINPTIYFTIHIINNLNHHLSCNIRILRPLDEDFLDVGYSYMINNLPNNKYQFKRD